MRFLHNFALMIAAFLLWSSAASATDVSFSNKHWDYLLGKYVSEVRGGKSTQVDYVSLSANSADLELLERYLSAISSVKLSEFESWDRNEQLAFLINTYNAFTVKLILSSDEQVGSIKELGSFFSSPWEKKFISLFGVIVSLDYVEHDLIREPGRYDEPRIHFAVNCASIGCPALRNEAYLAQQLDRQLEEQTQNFLGDETRNRYAKKRLTISPIFKWYKNDFERGWRGTNTLPQFLALYSTSLGLSDEQSKKLYTGDMVIKFGKYNWDLNTKK